ncbi:MAG: hypothetical protein DA328_01425 [Nitrososphaeraceae archaeon]|nr:hypothetical protein [Nitrososphaeraceae archaeon]
MKIIYFAIFSLFLFGSTIFLNNLTEISAQSNNSNITPIKTELLYSSNYGNITSVRVLDADEPKKIEVSFIEKGYLNKTIEVTNQGTFIETFLSDNIVRGEGYGIMTTQNAETIGWHAFDSGQISYNGSQIHKGIIFFNSGLSEKLSYFDNKIGLYINEVGEPDKSKNRYIWEWK